VRCCPPPCWCAMLRVHSLGLAAAPALEWRCERLNGCPAAPAAELEDRLQEQQAQLAAARSAAQQLEDAEVQLGRRRLELEAATAELSAKRREGSDMTRQLAELHAQRAAAEAELGLQRQELQGLAGDLQLRRQQLADLRADIARAQDEAAASRCAAAPLAGWCG
jgi:chromosome segregation ATPase